MAPPDTPEGSSGVTVQLAGVTVAAAAVTVAAQPLPSRALTWARALRDVLLQLIAELGFDRGVSVTPVVHKQQVGVIVVQDIQRVPCEVIHDVLS